MREVPIDQPVEGRKAEEAVALAAIVRNAARSRDVGRRHRDAQGLPKARRACPKAEQKRDDDTADSSAGHRAPRFPSSGGPREPLAHEGWRNLHAENIAHKSRPGLLRF